MAGTLNMASGVDRDQKNLLMRLLCIMGVLVACPDELALVNNLVRKWLGKPLKKSAMPLINSWVGNWHATEKQFHTKSH